MFANSDKIILTDDNRYTMLMQIPKVIMRYVMYDHFKEMGHTMIDISTMKMAENKIKCPIYWDNEDRRIVFNNYLCSCGRLFMFKAKFQGDKLEPTFMYGACPCNVCRFYKNGVGCCYED